MRPNLIDEQSKFVSLLEEKGPRIKQISRDLGLSAETLRYWFKNRILGHSGFAFVGIANYRRLGLRRYSGIAELTREARPFAKELFFMLYDVCGLSYYNRILPSGLYDVQFNVPYELEQLYSLFFRKLAKTGLFGRLELTPSDWYRRFPMKAHLFDFTKGRWEFDWESVLRERPLPVPENIEQRSTVDRQDVDIVAELQTDATRSISDVSKYLRIDYYEAFRHHRHIVRNQLLDCYRVNWSGSGLRLRSEDPKLFSAHSHPHRNSSFNLVFHNLSNSELAEVESKISKLPFVWSDQGGKGFYQTQIIVPLEYQHETFRYLESFLWELEDKLSFHIHDMTDAAWWTIPNQLFDTERNVWGFDENAALAKLDELLIHVKH